MTARLGPAVLVSLALAVCACGSENNPSVTPSETAETFSAVPSAQLTTSAPTAASTPRPATLHTADPDPLPTLQTNMAKWNASGVKNYRYRFTISCLCYFSHLPITMVVHDNELVSMTDTTGAAYTPGPVYDVYFRYATVDLMFQEIEKAAGEQYQLVGANYDAEFGFPVEIYENSTVASDGQSNVVISGFERLP